MKLCFVTDGLGDMSFENMLNTVQKLGVESLEIPCGNWSKAPHINLDEMVSDADARKKFMNSIKNHGMTLDSLNCSGNQLAPNDEGKQHQKVVEKTFQLAEQLGIKKIIMMSGLPGGSPSDTTPNWITTSWPPITTKILEWQWNEVAFPYWTKTVEQAKSHGIEKIALENHGCQLVYNPETLIKLRSVVGETVGMNFDPSHLMWMDGDPIAAIRKLGSKRIYHVHAKDVRVEGVLHAVNGALDTKTIDQFAKRSWNYVALGYGKDLRWWKEFFSVLSMIGYDGTISLEMEDLTMNPLTGVKKSLKVLKEAMPRDFEK